MQTTLLTKEKHEKLESWKSMFKCGENYHFDMREIVYDLSWKDMFEKLFESDLLDKISKELSEEIGTSKTEMYPPPELLFNTFKLTSFDDVKVVILGQDPYFHKGQAMGLSFSVPHKVETPSSLQNIYKNLKDHNHIKKIPKHGNLEFWAYQGCLMLNTSLTVLDGDKNKNCHQHVWKKFTNKIIQYISQNKKNVVFVLWGGSALEKLTLIDLDKHDVVASSHPSGLSVNKPLGKYPPFVSVDHFGEINRILKKWNMTPMVWDL